MNFPEGMGVAYNFRGDLDSFANSGSSMIPYIEETERKLRVCCARQVAALFSA